MLKNLLKKNADLQGKIALEDWKNKKKLKQDSAEIILRKPKLNKGGFRKKNKKMI